MKRLFLVRLFTVPYFSMDFRDLYALIKLLPSWFSGEGNLTRVPLGSLDTLPRFRLPLQTDGGILTEAYVS